MQFYQVRQLKIGITIGHSVSNCVLHAHQNWLGFSTLWQNFAFDTQFNRSHLRVRPRELGYLPDRVPYFSNVSSKTDLKSITPENVCFAFQNS